jgi:hypothetical protein
VKAALSYDWNTVLAIAHPKHSLPDLSEKINFILDLLYSPSSLSSCLSFLSAGITDVNHHTQLRNDEF